MSHGFIRQLPRRLLANGRMHFSVSREEFLKQTQEKVLQYYPDPLMRELRDRLEGKICKPVSYKFLEYARANGMWDLVRKASIQVTDGYVPGYTIALSSKKLIREMMTYCSNLILLLKVRAG